MRKIGVLLFLLATLYLDSTYILPYFNKGQVLLNGLCIVLLYLIYKGLRPRFRFLLIVSLIFALIGEYLFSVQFGWYTYRLDYVPPYIAAGQAIFYTKILEFSKHKFTRYAQKNIIRNCYAILMTGSFYYFYAFNDVFGLLMSCAVVLLTLLFPKQKLFFLLWYVIVFFIELVGVQLEVWQWKLYPIPFLEWLPSHNPPSGISLFYFLLGAISMITHRVFYPNVWQRLKNIRKTQGKK